jgi:copper(I)-binding protein
VRAPRLKYGRLGVLLSALMALPGIALAAQDRIEVEKAWSRAAMQGRVGVVYLTIVDHGAADRLTGVASPVAEKAELHESFSEGGVAKMRPVASLVVEQAKPVVLAPGGYHIMLIGLKQPLKQGDVFPITLSFANAGQLTAQVTVEQPGATATMPMHMPMPQGTPQGMSQESPSGKQP